MGQNRVARNVLLLAGGQAASWGFAMLWLVFVPRVLGPTVIGELVIATSVTAILGIFVTQGAGTLLTKEIARDPQVAGRLVSATLVMRLLCVIPAFVIASVYSWLLHFNFEQTVLIWLATGGMVTAALSGAFQAAFAGIERMEYMSYANVIGNGLTCVLGIALVLSGGGPVALLSLELALSALVLGLNILWGARLFPIVATGAVRMIPYIIRGGLSYWIGGLFFVAYLWIDSVLLSIMAPAKVVGWYGAPVQLFTAILMVTGVLCTAWFPRLASAYKEGESKLRELGKPAVETVVVFSLPIAVGLVLVAGPLVHLMAGSAFRGAVPVLMVLGLTVIPTSFNMMAYQILLAANRQVAWIKVVAVATVLNIVLNLVLVPHFQAAGNGAVGTALSLLASEVFEALCALVMLRWLLQPSVAGRALRAAIATGLMAIGVLLVAPLGLFVEVVCGVLWFGAMAIVLRVASQAELAEFRGVGLRLRRSGSGAA
jgi:O-antigen/teichoic acid export membrane protein